jgi:hypothetical protein
VPTFAIARARIERRAAFRPADEHGRLGVAEEVRDLGGLIRGVERQVDEAAAQTREIERTRPPSSSRSGAPRSAGKRDSKIE